MNIFNIFRRKKQPVEPVKLPVAGEYWFIENDSPWPQENGPKVVILDQKDGWVRYSFGGYLFRDERMSLDMFMRVYKPCGDSHE